MRKKNDTLTRSEVTENVEKHKEDMSEKVDELDTIATDKETVGGLNLPLPSINFSLEAYHGYQLFLCHFLEGLSTNMYQFRDRPMKNAYSTPIFVQ